MSFRPMNVLSNDFSSNFESVLENKPCYSIVITVYFPSMLKDGIVLFIPYWLAYGYVIC